MYNGNTTIGTMAYNAVGSNGQGGAIYQNGNLSIGGGTWIPAGDNGKHDIYLSEYGRDHYVTIITASGDYNADCTVLTHEGIVAQITPVKLSASAYNTNISVIQNGYSGGMTTKKFSITPITYNGATTSWELKYQSSMVKLYQLGSGTVTVNFNVNTTDVSVTVKSGTTPITSNQTIPGGSTLTFTAQTPKTGSSYTWYVDGEVQTVAQADTLVLDTSDTTTWTSGIYDILLEATDSSGQLYSYFAQIKIN